MPQEIIATLISIISIGGTLAVQRIITNWTRSRSEKESEEAKAQMDSLDVDLKRFDTSKIKDQAIKDLVNDTYQWIDDMNLKLNDMRASNLKLEAAVFEITKRAEAAERERDWLKDMLKRLVHICISRCPDLEIEEFKDAIEEIEEIELSNEETDSK